jgi:antitoxin CcdA
MSNGAAARKRATNVTLDVSLVDQAREMGINVSRACEQGLEEQVRKARSAAWLEENRAAIEGWNRYVEEKGLPLARHRRF